MPIFCERLVMYDVSPRSHPQEYLSKRYPIHTILNEIDAMTVKLHQNGAVLYVEAESRSRRFVLNTAAFPSLNCAWSTATT
jgi:hypothetical protein